MILTSCRMVECYNICASVSHSVSNGSKTFSALSSHYVYKSILRTILLKWEFSITKRNIKENSVKISCNERWLLKNIYCRHFKFFLWRQCRHHDTSPHVEHVYPHIPRHVYFLKLQSLLEESYTLKWTVPNNCRMALEYVPISLC